MAEGKKSFMLYTDQKSIFNKLSDEQAGKLIKHIFSYVNDENPVLEDEYLDLAFEFIKLQLKRDLKKWENIVERNRINGSKGGRPKKPKKPNGLIGNPKKPKKADNDNDTDIVNDNDINNIPTKAEFMLYVKSKVEDKSYDIIRDDCILKYESWVENNWKDGNNKKIKNWKSKMLNTLTYIKANRRVS